MKSIVLSLSLMLCPASLAATVVIPIQDILMEIPTFSNAPDFYLVPSLNGKVPVGNAGKTSSRKTKKEREQELIDFVRTMYPNATSIHIWNGNIIVRIP
jgi:hypothetical protein